MESKEFLENLNAMLSKFNVKKMQAKNKEQEDEWDDLPF